MSSAIYNDPRSMSATPVAARHWSDRRIALFIFVIGSVMGLAWMSLPGFQATLKFSEEERIGLHLARGHGYRSPFDESAASPPTSWSPPIYPGIVGAVYYLTGGRGDAGWALLLDLNMLARGAVAAGLFMLGKQCFDKRAGLLAAALFLLHPMFLQLTTFFWDNMLALAAFVWLLVAGISMNRGKVTAWKMAGMGLAVALLVQANASYSTVAPLLIALPLVALPWRARFRHAGLALAIFILALLPWTIRNCATFHKLFFIRDNVSLELWLGNQPGARGWICTDYMQLHPSISPSEKALILGIGETAYFRLCSERFHAEYHTAKFIETTLRRIVYVFLSDPTTKTDYPLMPNWKVNGDYLDRYALNAVLVIFAAAGLWIALRLCHRGLAFALPVAAFTLPFALSHVDDRLTMPIRAIMLLLAAFALVSIHARLTRGTWMESAN